MEKIIAVLVLAFLATNAAVEGKSIFNIRKVIVKYLSGI